MARFLSDEWFAELGPAGAATPSPVPPGPVPPGPVQATERVGGPGMPELAIGIVVTGTPDGEVRYQVVVREGRPAVLAPGSSPWPSQVTLTADYATMCAMASGAASAIDVLMEGKARISGDTGALSAHAQALSGLDLLPASVRSRTTF